MKLAPPLKSFARAGEALELRSDRRLQEPEQAQQAGPFPLLDQLLEVHHFLRTELAEYHFRRRRWLFHLVLQALAKAA